METKTDLLLWTSGGFAAGCLLGVWLSKSMKRYKTPSALKYIEDKILGKESSVDKFNKKDSTRQFNENITTYSELSMLMGSPTASSIETSSVRDGDLAREYQMYTASKNYPDLTNNRTIMARYLTEELYTDLYSLRTSSGCNLDTCIQAGIDNPGKISCGIIAGDEECYDVFSGLFDQVITDRHRGFERGTEWLGEELTPDMLKSELFDPKYVKSTHLLAGRCFKGFRFPPSCRRAERNHVENLMKNTLKSLTDDFSGTYLHLCDLTPDQRYHLPDVLQTLVKCPNSNTLVSCGSIRDWPSGRGLFYSDDLHFYAWTNREDHLRLMYRDREMDFVHSFKQFLKALKQLESNMVENGLEFSKHPYYGYLLSCPSGIGTALRAGVHMKLPLLTRDSRFQSILKNFRLHMGCEDKEMYRNGYVDVYNMDRLGYAECYLIQHVINSVHVLTEMERMLERKESITNLITASLEYE